MSIVRPRRLCCSLVRKVSKMSYFNYDQVFRKEMGCFSLDELKKILSEVVPAGTKDEDVLIEIEKEDYTSYYDDLIIDLYLVVSIKQEKKAKK